MTDAITQKWVVDARVLELLACPACRGNLRVEKDRLVCVACGRGYPVVDGIPVLVPEG